MADLQEMAHRGGEEEDGGKADFLPSLAEGSRCGVASTRRVLRVPGTSRPSGAEEPYEPARSSEGAMLSRSVGPQEALSPPHCSHIHHPGAWTVALKRGETQGYQTHRAKVRSTRLNQRRYLERRVVQTAHDVC